MAAALGLGPGTEKCVGSNHISPTKHRSLCPTVTQLDRVTVFNLGALG